jgi:YD repeat-containing protein
MAEPFGKCCNAEPAPELPNVGCADGVVCNCDESLDTPPLMEIRDGCDPSTQVCAGSSECPGDVPQTPIFHARPLNQAAMPFDDAKRRLQAPLLAITSPAPAGGQSCSGKLNFVTGNLNLAVGPPRSGPLDPRPKLSYSSMADGGPNPFGRRWSNQFSQTVEEIDASTVRLIKGDGGLWIYTDPDPGTGLYTTPPGAKNSLKQDSGWTETQSDGTKLHYETVGSFGRLNYVQAPGGARWTVSYDNDLPVTVLDPLNRRTTYQYDGSDNLQAIVDPAGRRTTFAVDALGQLTTITSAELCITGLEYDALRRISAVVTPAGYRTTYSYDGNGRVVASVSPKGERTTLAYDTDSTTITDALGRISTVIRDVDGNVVEVINPFNGRSTYTWDTGRVVALTDANSNTTTLAYAASTDGVERLESITKPSGAMTTYAYDGGGHVETVINALGHRTTLVWSANLRTAVIDQLGFRTTFSYNALGQVESETNPLGYTTTQVYDQARIVPSDT